MLGSSDLRLGFNLGELETCPDLGLDRWAAGSSRYKDKLAQLGLELGLSLAIFGHADGGPRCRVCAS